MAVAELIKKILLMITLLCIYSISKAQNDTTYFSNFKDSRDGKVYKTFIIGNQEWFAENLNFDVEGSWCEKCELYGRMYSFKDATIACPDGWHIPSLEEWKSLVLNLGGEELINNKMKYGNEWMNSSVPNSDSSKFCGISTPYVTTDRKVREIGHYATWWTSTLALEPANWTYRITYNKNKIECYGFYKVSGFSVRCVRNL